MSERKIPIGKATVEQLREFATMHLGLQLEESDTADTIRAKIAAATDRTDITVADPEPAAKSRKKTNDEPAGKTGEFIVRIGVQETFDGNEPVPLGCNGRIILVPRDRWCAVPIQYLDSLVNAVEARRDPVKDGGLGPVRYVSRYPYQLWSGPGEPTEDGGVLRPSVVRQVA